ncbi:MAG: LPS export ABC transporter periplasmic protein LptC [Candidatus Omnitrophica bacterium]|nr:LPS export ABC transporter periplasmic protein LptC [Candidatus Omnitrophota bacterium]
MFNTLLILVGLLVIPGCGCGPHDSRQPPAGGQKADGSAGEQQMDRFSMVGYAEDGSRRWELQGVRASAEGQVVRIKQPEGVGYEAPSEVPKGKRPRTAYLTASTGQMNQQSRRVLLEDRVSIHTSEGLWLAAPTLYWLPDQSQVLTDQPVQLETDRMLLKARGATAHTELKQAVFHRDIDLVLVPESHPGTRTMPGQMPSARAASGQAVITCDGPLSLYYDRGIAVFERRVHVRDPQGDLYSDKLIAYLDEARQTIRYAEALSHVRIIQAGHLARSERAIYDPRHGTITLVGAPSLQVDRDGSGSKAQPGKAPVPPTVGQPKQMPATAAAQPVPGAKEYPTHLRGAE